MFLDIQAYADEDSFFAPLLIQMAYFIKYEYSDEFITREEAASVHLNELIRFLRQLLENDISGFRDLYEKYVAHSETNILKAKYQLKL